MHNVILLTSLPVLPFYDAYEPFLSVYKFYPFCLFMNLFSQFVIVLPVLPFCEPFLSVCDSFTFFSHSVLPVLPFCEPFLSLSV